MTDAQTLVVGGGLSGLSVASALHARGHAVHLVEARERLGGRILSAPIEHASSQAHFDLGPAWFWEGQPRIARLIESLKLQVFAQYAEGSLLFEDERGQVHRDRGFSSMEGSLRVAGGLVGLVDGVAQRLPAARRATGVRATRVEMSAGGLKTTLVASDGTSRPFQTENVVLAIPPRVAAATIDFAGEVSEGAQAAMKAVPTWMGGHAKVVAVYAQPFWRTAGLSGDAMSRRGPLAEVHDASPATGAPFALFGFVGVPASRRAGAADLLSEASIAQLVRLFGAEAAHPLDVLVQDWAFEPETSSALDHAPLGHHPDYGLPPALRELCGGRLLFGSTEVASRFGGYLEGALEAAEFVVDTLDG